MNKRIGSALGTIVMLLIVATVLWLTFVTVPTMKCESLAQTMQRPFIFSPVNGCWVQTV